MIVLDTNVLSEEMKSVVVAERIAAVQYAGSEFPRLAADFGLTSSIDVPTPDRRA